MLGILRLSLIHPKRNVNNNKERTPSPKSARPSPRMPQPQAKRPSSFPATSTASNGLNGAAAAATEEDVNVKERAAIFGPRKGSGRGLTSKIPGVPGISPGNPGRKKSEDPGSPSKIKNMAALFENA